MDDEELGALEDEDEEEVEEEHHAAAPVNEATEVQAETRPKKRKRAVEADGDLEDGYLRKLAREDARDEERRRLEDPGRAALEDKRAVDEDGEEESPTMTDDIPLHETVAGSKDEAVEKEKAARTVFLSNVSTEVVRSKKAKKQLISHLSSILASLPTGDLPHKVESIRFRSLAFSTYIPKKAAYARKELMDATTKGTNAYAVYSTKAAALEAAKRLNGTVVLNRHLRVDNLAKPAPIDHHRCVFIGNLNFVDEKQNNENGDEDKPKKKREPGDAEEGLWREFSKVGQVESVRVVRDEKTRVGKGIAYVQFADEVGAEQALQLDGKKFPPLLPRKLRVLRAKSIKRSATKGHPGAKKVDQAERMQPNKSVKGRMDKKGKPATKASHKRRERTTLWRKEQREADAGRVSEGGAVKKPGASGMRKPEAFVFEGHRASSKEGKSGLKFDKKGSKGAKVRAGRRR